jgi:hypothetical protein
MLNILLSGAVRSAQPGGKRFDRSERDLWKIALGTFSFLSIEGAEPEHKKPILVFNFGGVIAEAAPEIGVKC